MASPPPEALRLETTSLTPFAELARGYLRTSGNRVPPETVDASFDRFSYPIPPPGANLLEFYSQPVLPGYPDAPRSLPELASPSDQDSPAEEILAASPKRRASPLLSPAAASEAKRPRADIRWKSRSVDDIRRERQNQHRKDASAALKDQPGLLATIARLELAVDVLTEERDDLREKLCAREDQYSCPLRERQHPRQYPFLPARSATDVLPRGSASPTRTPNG